MSIATISLTCPGATWVRERQWARWPIVYKFLSATDRWASDRARRIFHIMYVWLGCGIASVYDSNFIYHINYTIIQSQYFIFHEILQILNNNFINLVIKLLYQWLKIKITIFQCDFYAIFTQWSLAIVSRFQENGT